MWTIGPTWAQDYGAQRIIVAPTAIVVPDVVTPLLSFGATGQPFGEKYRALIGAFVNEDLSNEIEITVETSERYVDTAHYALDGDYRKVIVVPIATGTVYGQACWIWPDAGMPPLRSRFRVSARCLTVGQTAALNYALRGLPRF